jgi:hypothetical protein
VDFATLPKGNRPTHQLFITVYTFDGAPGIIIVNTNGVLEALPESGASTDTATEFTSLAGVSFPVNS